VAKTDTLTRKVGNGKALVIVESPAKAKTIGKYLGPEFQVRASVGHIRDLPKQGLNVDVEHGFAPTYIITPGREKVVSELRAAAKACSEVYLATDLDREGEAIAWHLTQALGLDPKTAKRVVFNEITKTAILAAFKNPRIVNEDKVLAQQARRIVDRLVGYKISPLLWKKVGSGLSAGRVQSVAVKLIVERERELQAFVPEEYWKLTAVFTTDLQAAPELAQQWRVFLQGEEEEVADDGTDSATAAGLVPPTIAEKTEWMRGNHAFRADLISLGDAAGATAGKDAKFDPKTAAEARKAAEAVGLRILDVQVTTNDGTNGPRGIPAKGPATQLTRVIGEVKSKAEGGPEFVVRELVTKQSTSRPPAPFATSTLQQAASNALGFGAQRTMRVAQQLYEGVELEGIGAVGLITYMRTDSTVISQDALKMAREFIGKSFGDKYLPDAPNIYASRAGAQEAHEAIRPTDVNLTPADVRRSLTEEQHKLYELIWKRFVGCQMMPAIWAVTEAYIEARRAKSPPTSGGAIFKATGRSLVFDGFMKVTGVYGRFDEQLLPKLAEKQEVAPVDLTPGQHFTAPPSRYSEASLVKALEAEGIGRPSTYASIIGTIQDRNYVESKGRTLYATDLGMKVTDKLIEGFPDLMETGFTRRIEEELDEIEDAKRDWVAVVDEFYQPLARDLVDAETRMTHARAEQVPSEYKCPKCGAMMAYRLSKRGKRFLSCSTYPICNGAQNVDREGKPQALELTDYKCPVCGKPMIKRVGRFGPFFGCSGYPECKTIQAADRKTGEPLPPKPPPVPTGLKCPKCHKKELVVRKGKRGDFLSCAGYPKCRFTLQSEKLEEYKAAAAAGQWPTADVLAKAKGGKGAAKGAEAAEPVAAAVAKPKKAKPRAKKAKAETAGPAVE